MTDVWFAIRRANLNLDENGNVESVLDAGLALQIYRDLCQAEGHSADVIGV